MISQHSYLCKILTFSCHIVLCVSQKRNKILKCSMFAKCFSKKLFWSSDANLESVKNASLTIPCFPQNWQHTLFDLFTFHFS